MKEWLINVLLKKMGPSAIRAALAFVVGIIAAHAGLLAGFGVVYDATAKTITLHIDTLQEWLLGGGLGLITATLTAIQHHTVAAITGAPQTGAANPPQGGTQ